MMKTSASFVLLALVMGCGGAESTTPGASTVSAASDAGDARSAETLDAEDYCNSEQRSGATGDPAKRAQIASEWMSKRARTEWFRKLMTKTSSGSLDPVQKDSMLRNDFADRGVTSCPTLDKHDPNGMH